MRLSGTFDECADRWADRVLLLWSGGQATYAEVARAVARQAEQFTDAGITRGVRIGVALPNRPELIVLWLAATRVGAMVAFLNPAQTRSDLRRAIADLDLAVVFGERFASDVDVAQVELVQPWAAASVRVPRVRPVIHVEDAGAAILLTSGSTSSPKYVEVPHAAYVLKGRHNADRLGHRPDDRFLGVMPLFHAGAQCETLLPAMMAGASIRLVDHFSSSTFWSVVADSQVTVVHSTASLLLMAFDRGVPVTPSTLRLIVTSLRDDLTLLLAGHLPHTSVATLYGLTECPLGTLGVLSGTYRPGQVGEPYGSRNDFRFVGEAGVVAEEGEIQIRNPACAIRYIGLDDSELRTADNWTRTGDIGRWTEDGLQLVGRIKEMIRRSGENIAPAEVETTLARHPDVADVVVFGEPDGVHGEEVRALVVLRAGTRVDEAVLHDFAAQHLARFKLPRYIDLCDGFPKTASNKPDRRRIVRESGPPRWDSAAPGRRGGGGQR